MRKVRNGQFLSRPSSIGVALTCGLLIGSGIGRAPASAAGLSLDTTSLWNGATFVNTWGSLNSPTYGQTVTLPGSGILRNFSFYLKDKDINPASADYRAYVFQWNAVAMAPTGQPLFSSSSRNVSLSSAQGFQQVSVDTSQFDVPLLQGIQYVLFLSTVGEASSLGGAIGFGSITDGYSGGEWVVSNNSSNFMTAPWDGYASDDLAFQATIDTPQTVPAPLPSLGAGAAFAWSRRLRRRIRRAAAHGSSASSSSRS